MRVATMRRAAGVAYALALAASCDGDALRRYGVQIAAEGVLRPVSITLAHPGGSETLEIQESGAAAFATAMGDGDSYSVALVGAPPCVLARASGVIAGADPIVALTCDGVATLAELALVGPAAPDLEFSPAQRSYSAQVPLLQQALRLRATAASPGARITIAGAPIPSGVPTAPYPLLLGTTALDIVVAHPLGWERTYQLAVSRGAHIAQHAYGKASNGARNDFFGFSLALQGDTLAVGAFLEDSGAADNPLDNSELDSGAVYVFHRGGSGWVQEAYLKASHIGARDAFGFSVALEQDVLAVGAFAEDSAAVGVGGNQDDEGAMDSGAVYLFRRDGSTWQQEAYLKASNTGVEDNFGYSLALSGDTLAVSAINEDSSGTGAGASQSSDSAPDSGAVYLFRRTGTSWVQTDYLKASNTGAGDWFGWALALAGDTLAVGAYLEDSSATGVGGDQSSDSAPDSGAVYVFRRADTSWAQEAYIKASNTSAGDWFGRTVALHGDRMAAGAYGEDSSATGVGGDQSSDSAPDSGAVYVFRRADTSWAQEAYIKASNTSAGDELGTGLALVGDLLAAGAYREDSAASGPGGDGAHEGAEDSGAVYLFRRGATGWEPAMYIKSSNPEAGDGFGRAVALSGDTLAVGAFAEDSRATGVDGDQTDNSAPNSGAWYVFH